MADQGLRCLAWSEFGTANYGNIFLMWGLHFFCLQIEQKQRLGREWYMQVAGSYWKNSVCNSISN
jgi:hypothetical protein